MDQPSETELAIALDDLTPGGAISVCGGEDRGDMGALAAMRAPKQNVKTGAETTQTFVRKKGVLARGQNTIWAKVLEMPRTVDW